MMRWISSSLPSSIVLVTALSFSSYLAPGGPVGAADAETAWSALAELRMALETGGAVEATFEQTLLPSGFSSGTTESGTLVLSLPHCMRYDYTDPDAKFFLLCGNQVYYWHAGETIGQRFEIDSADTPGLDFFFLPPAELEKRYEASASVVGDDLVLDLTPLTPTEDLVSAQVTLDAKHQRITRLSYSNAEGDLNRFEISDYKTTQADSSRFEPPPDIEWEDS